MKEEEVKNKYLNNSLQIYDKRRVCLTINQLKLVLGKSDNFNNIFLDLCQKKLEKKNSLDFDDLSILIEKSINEVKKTDPNDQNSSFVTFKPKQSMNIEERIKYIEELLEFDDYLLCGILGTYSCFEMNLLLNETEDTLKSFKKRIENLEKRQINMDKIINYFADKIKEEKDKK